MLWKGNKHNNIMSDIIWLIPKLTFVLARIKFCLPYLLISQEAVRTLQSWWARTARTVQELLELCWSDHHCVFGPQVPLLVFCRFWGATTIICAIARRVNVYPEHEASLLITVLFVSIYMTFHNNRPKLIHLQNSECSRVVSNLVPLASERSSLQWCIQKYIFPAPVLPL